MFTVDCHEDFGFRIREVFSEIRKGTPRSRALNERRIQKIGDIEPISRRISQTVPEGLRLLLVTNRKSHTPFRLTLTLTTLNNPE